MRGLNDKVAIENAKFGIRVNAVNPGYTHTDMLTADMDDPDSQIKQAAAPIPAGRLGRPSEIAAAIAFLASDDATYCSGTTLVIDGGLTA